MKKKGGVVNDDTNSRRNFLSTATIAVATIPLQSSASISTDKQLNLSNEELKK